MIEVKNLTKRYGSKLALDQINFTVEDGQVLGFLGPNGAGKSTTMNIITGYISATEGTVTVNGEEIFQNPIAVKKQIGYLPEQPPLYLDMTVQEYLEFMFSLKKIRLPRKSHLAEVCALVGISEVYTRLIQNLSKGYRQRVGLAQALLGFPSLLILDEPTVGLDPAQILEIRNLVHSLSSKHTIILSSHILSEVQETCDRIIVINQGVILADGTTEELSRAVDNNQQISVTLRAPHQAVSRALQSFSEVQKIDFVSSASSDETSFYLQSKQGVDLRQKMFRLAVDNHWDLLELHTKELSLEDIFLQLTHSDSSEDTPKKSEVKSVEQEWDEPSFDEESQQEEEFVSEAIDEIMGEKKPQTIEEPVTSQEKAEADFDAQSQLEEAWVSEAIEDTARSVKKESHHSQLKAKENAFDEESREQEVLASEAVEDVVHSKTHKNTKKRGKNSSKSKGGN